MFKRGKKQDKHGDDTAQREAVPQALNTHDSAISKAKRHSDSTQRSSEVQSLEKATTNQGRSGDKEISIPKIEPKTEPPEESLPEIVQENQTKDEKSKVKKLEDEHREVQKPDDKHHKVQKPENEHHEVQEPEDESHEVQKFKVRGSDLAKLDDVLENEDQAAHSNEMKLPDISTFKTFATIFLDPHILEPLEESPLEIVQENQTKDEKSKVKKPEDEYREVQKPEDEHHEVEKSEDEHREVQKPNDEHREVQKFEVKDSDVAKLDDVLENEDQAAHSNEMKPDATTFETSAKPILEEIIAPQGEISVETSPEVEAYIDEVNYSNVFVQQNRNKDRHIHVL